MKIIGVMNGGRVLLVSVHGEIRLYVCTLQRSEVK